jgi:hypothetical protein
MASSHCTFRHSHAGAKLRRGHTAVVDPSYIEWTAKNLAPDRRSDHVSTYEVGRVQHCRCTSILTLATRMPYRETAKWRGLRA